MKISLFLYALRHFCLFGPLGIEPNLPAPKAGVLPVYYGPIGFCLCFTLNEFHEIKRCFTLNE